MDLPPIPIPVIQVNPLLSDADIDIIKSQVYALSQLPRKLGATAFAPTDHIQAIRDVSTALSALIDGVDTIAVKADLTKGQLINLAGYRIGKNEHQGKQIVRDLHEREALGAVILEEDGFMLFHAKSSGVTQPVMMIFRPEVGVFTAIDASNIHVVVILLIPPDVHPELHRLMSVLSASLLEDDIYKSAVFGDDKYRLKQEVKRCVSEPFNAWILTQVTP